MTLIRLIATDLDDTLLDAHSDVTARTVSAVRRAMDAGALFSLSSGRMPEAMLPLAEKLNVNAPMILYNGALIYDHRTGRTLFSNAIPAETALAVVRMLEQMGLYVQAYPGKGYYCERRCAFTEGYERSIRVPATELGVPVSQWMQGDMVKLLAIAPPEELDRALPTLRAAFPTVNFMKSRPHYCEIVARGIDKGVALRKLGEMTGVAVDEIMAFGDGQNDVSMLAAAGIGVAMENAVEDCRRAAKRIAPRNTEDGVAQVIEELLAAGQIGGAANG